jgi:hypothetical protein
LLAKTNKPVLMLASITRRQTQHEAEVKKANNCPQPNKSKKINNNNNNNKTEQN